MIFKSDKTYDILKWIFTVVLPALAGAYVKLAEIWADVKPLPYPAQIGGTILLIVAVADAILGYSSIKYREQAAANLQQAVDELQGGESHDPEL